jgi:hypothetical protein
MNNDPSTQRNIQVTVDQVKSEKTSMTDVHAQSLSLQAKKGIAQTPLAQHHMV